jgi:hypothetical protein
MLARTFEKKDALQRQVARWLSIGLGAWRPARIYFTNAAYIEVKSYYSHHTTKHHGYML